MGLSVNSFQISLLLLWLGYGFDLWSLELIPSSLSSLEGVLFVIAALMLMLNRSKRVALVLGSIACILGIFDVLFNYGVTSSVNILPYFFIEIVSAVIFLQGTLTVLGLRSFVPEQFVAYVPDINIRSSVTDHVFDKDKDKLFTSLNVVSLAFCIVYLAMFVLYAMGLATISAVGGQKLMSTIATVFGFQPLASLAIGFVVICLVILMTAILFRLAQRNPRFRVAVCAIYSYVLVSTVLNFSSGIYVSDLLVVIYCSAALYSGLIVHFRRPLAFVTP